MGFSLLWSASEQICYLKEFSCAATVNNGFIFFQRSIPSYKQMLGDCGGNDIETYDPVSLEKCAESCDETIGCKGFSYVRKRCILKGASCSSPEGNTWVFFEKWQDTAPGYFRPGVGSECPGNTLKEVTGSLWLCTQECDQEVGNGCGGFTYDAASSKCSLKTAYCNNLSPQSTTAFYWNDKVPPRASLLSPSGRHSPALAGRSVSEPADGVRGNRSLELVQRRQHCQKYVLLPSCYRMPMGGLAGEGCPAFSECVTPAVFAPGPMGGRSGKCKCKCHYCVEMMFGLPTKTCYYDPNAP